MRKKLGNCTILDFADILAWEMIKEAEDIEEKGKKKREVGLSSNVSLLQRMLQQFQLFVKDHPKFLQWLLDIRQNTQESL